ncbi:hypothetical protein [Mesorhizobium sp. L-8-3]|uniref:hypothetical protein n=1 Tax=Mesorhizobium sp. L-8-3 TaxID=2744522 RepID=UPI0019272F28|nr:hypothetical protein [Mesorhizobium sp. L-8-3]BCH21115.1 hypothetical protein MesoLjLb_09000 [Mesorhizobium sp. L-8-3]
MSSFQYFSHSIDEQTLFCTGCGRFLSDLQSTRRWRGNKVHPTCLDSSNVAAISHIVRNRAHRSR